MGQQGRTGAAGSGSGGWKRLSDIGEMEEPVTRPKSPWALPTKRSSARGHRLSWVDRQKAPFPLWLPNRQAIASDRPPLKYKIKEGTRPALETLDHTLLQMSQIRKDVVGLGITGHAPTAMASGVQEEKKSRSKWNGITKLFTELPPVPEPPKGGHFYGANTLLLPSPEIGRSHETTASLLRSSYAGRSSKTSTSLARPSATSTRRNSRSYSRSTHHPTEALFDQQNPIVGHSHGTTDPLPPISPQRFTRTREWASRVQAPLSSGGKVYPPNKPIESSPLSAGFTKSPDSDSDEEQEDIDDGKSFHFDPHPGVRVPVRKLTVPPIPWTPEEAKSERFTDRSSKLPGSWSPKPPHRDAQTPTEVHHQLSPKEVLEQTGYWTTSPRKYTTSPIRYNSAISPLLGSGSDTADSLRRRASVNQSIVVGGSIHPAFRAGFTTAHIPLTATPVLPPKQRMGSRMDQPEPSTPTRLSSTAEAKQRKVTHATEHTIRTYIPSSPVSQGKQRMVSTPAAQSAESILNQLSPVARGKQRMVSYATESTIPTHTPLSPMSALKQRTVSARTAQLAQSLPTQLSPSTEGKQHMVSQRATEPTVRTHTQLSPVPQGKQHMVSTAAAQSAQPTVTQLSSWAEGKQRMVSAPQPKLMQAGRSWQPAVAQRKATEHPTEKVVSRADVEQQLQQPRTPKGKLTWLPTVARGQQGLASSPTGQPEESTPALIAELPGHDLDGAKELQRTGEHIRVTGFAQNQQARIPTPVTQLAQITRKAIAKPASSFDEELQRAAERQTQLRRLRPSDLPKLATLGVVNESQRANENRIVSSPVAQSTQPIREHDLDGLQSSDGNRIVSAHATQPTQVFRKPVTTSVSPSFDEQVRHAIERKFQLARLQQENEPTPEAFAASLGIDDDLQRAVERRRLSSAFAEPTQLAPIAQSKHARPSYSNELRLADERRSQIARLRAIEDSKPQPVVAGDALQRAVVRRALRTASQPERMTTPEPATLLPPIKFSEQLERAGNRNAQLSRLPATDLVSPSSSSESDTITGSSGASDATVRPLPRNIAGPSNLAAPTAFSPLLDTTKRPNAHKVTPIDMSKPMPPSRLFPEDDEAIAAHRAACRLAATKIRGVTQTKTAQYEAGELPEAEERALGLQVRKSSVPWAAEARKKDAWGKIRDV